jgi:transcriptional regulator with XRE-family HTH domain
LKVSRQARSVRTLIKQAREATGLSQDELAARCGVTQQAVAKWESGVSTPRPPTLKKVASTLLIDTNLLLRAAGYLDDDDGDDDPTPPATAATPLQLAALNRKLADATPDEFARVEAFLEGLFSNRDK